MKGKIGDSLVTGRLIGIVLVVLVVIAAIFGMYYSGILDKLNILPGFDKNNSSEQITPENCDYLVARVISDKLYFCHGNENCDQNTEGAYRGIHLDKSSLILDCRGCTSPFASGNQVGVFAGDIVYLTPGMVEGVGETYFDSKYSLDYEGFRFEDLLNLDKSNLLGDSYLCRDSRVDSEDYFRKVNSVKSGDKEFYFDVRFVLSNQNIKNSAVYYDSELKKIAKSYIDANSKLVYSEGDKEVQPIYIFENEKHTDLIRQNLPLDNSNGQLGVNSGGQPIIGFISGGAPIDGTPETNNAIRFYYGSESNRKFVGPWIKTEYWLEYGNLARLEEKPWACKDNICEFD